MEYQNQELIDTSTTTMSNQVGANGNGDKKQQTAADVQAWLVSYLAQLLDMKLDEVNVTTSFDRYGLDSSATIGLTSDLGDWLGRAIDPTITYDYPSIQTLAEHLAG